MCDRFARVVIFDRANFTYVADFPVFVNHTVF